MHFAIVEDLAMDQEHLIRPLPCGFYGYYAGSERFKWH